MSPSISHLTRKDFLTCLGIWVALEMVCFLLFPITGSAQPEGGLESWFLTSIPLGTGGAFLVGASSWLTEVSHSHHRGVGKVLQFLLAGLIGCFGLAGVAFPLLVISLQIFTAILSRL